VNGGIEMLIEALSLSGVFGFLAAVIAGVIG
jgi:hypothetical protein